MNASSLTSFYNVTARYSFFGHPPFNQVTQDSWHWGLCGDGQAVRAGLVWLVREADHQNCTFEYFGVLAGGVELDVVWLWWFNSQLSLFNFIQKLNKNEKNQCYYDKQNKTNQGRIGIRLSNEMAALTEENQPTENGHKVGWVSHPRVRREEGRGEI